MLLPSRVAGRTLGLRGPDLARGPEVARPWAKQTTPLALCCLRSLIKVDVPNKWASER